jgi:hypothetical protein
MRQGMTMRITASTLIFILLATAANAGDWAYEDGDTPIAYVDNGVAQFQFACRGGDFAMGYWVRFPHRTVANAASLNVAITPDPKGAGVSAAAGASFAQDMPLIHSDGTSMIVRGPVAKQWARIAQKAKSSIRVAYVRKHGELEVFDSNDFAAAGSSAAIKQVLDRCG